MKIKIVEPGNEGFTGQLGNVQFVGGVSTGAVTEAAAAGIAAIYRIERIGADVEQVEEQVEEEVTPTGQETAETPSQEADSPSEEQKAEEQAETKE